MAYVDSKTTYNAGTNSLTITTPTYTTGDVLIAIWTQDGNATLTKPTGWTQVRTDHVSNGDVQTMAWAWKVSTGSDSFTFTGSNGSSMAGSVASYSGRDGTTPVEISSGNNPNLSTPPNSPVTLTGTGVTTSTNGCDIVMMGSVDSSGFSGSFTAGGSLTLRTSTGTGLSFSTSALADYNQTSAGATGDQTMTWTLASTHGNFVAYLVALKPSSGGGVSVALTGQAGTFSAGTLSPSSTVALAGSAGSFSSGTLAPGIGVNLTGSSGTFSAGSLSIGISIPLAGEAGTFSTGIITISGSNVSIALTGEAAAFSAGTLGVSIAAGLTGSLASFSAGTLSPAFSVTITGSLASFTAGSVSATHNVPLAGSALSIQTGTITPTGGTPVAGETIEFVGFLANIGLLMGNK